jgi:acylphosphatase
MSGAGEGVVARRMIAEGRVQGVGFRWYVMTRAQALGVGGWVRNLPDGRVEVVAVASPETVARLEAAVRDGPPGAHVSRVTSSDIPHEDVDAKSFTVRH